MQSKANTVRYHPIISHCITAGRRCRWWIAV